MNVRVRTQSALWGFINDYSELKEVLENDLAGLNNLLAQHEILHIVTR